MLSFRYITKLNNILAQHHSNNIAVMTINADTNAKSNITVHDNTCCTKWNNNDWSYPSNGTKCSTIVVILLLLCSWQLKNKKYSLLTISNHLLFDVQTAYSNTKERERSIRVYEQKHKEPQPNWTLWMPTDPTFSKFVNISKLKVSAVLCHLAKLLHHSHMSKFTVFVYSIKLVTRHESILLTFGYSCADRRCTGLNFPIWLKFPLKDFSSLNSLLKTVGFISTSTDEEQNHEKCSD